jgi:hypothetical protein
VQSDWRGEYHRLHKYFLDHGSIHYVSCPHTHTPTKRIRRTKTSTYCRNQPSSPCPCLHAGSVLG